MVVPQRLIKYRLAVCVIFRDNFPNVYAPLPSHFHFPRVWLLHTSHLATQSQLQNMPIVRKLSLPPERINAPNDPPPQYTDTRGSPPMHIDPGHAQHPQYAPARVDQYAAQYPSTKSSPAHTQASALKGGISQPTTKTLLSVLFGLALGTYNFYGTATWTWDQSVYFQSMSSAVGTWRCCRVWSFRVYAITGIIRHAPVYGPNTNIPDRRCQ